MRHPGSTEPGSAVGGVGNVSVGYFDAAIESLRARAESRRDATESAATGALSARAPAAPATALRRKRVGVTAAVQSAGIVAHRAGTPADRAGVVSRAAFVETVSWALPAFSQANAASGARTAAAISDAAR